jgi:predicted transcriptional regulator
MGNPVFDFAIGPYPKESRIAQAKRNAVGGKRKRCTKGKNCSAACIAANMVCLVDLPWVGPSLTKAAAQIQAMKKKAGPAAKPAPAAKAAPAPAAAPQPAAVPAAKPAPVATPQPAATPAAQPAAKPLTAKPAKKAIDKVPTVEEYKKWGVVQLGAAIANLQNSPNVKPDAPVTKKVIGNMEEALKQLAAEKTAAAAKPGTAPTAKPAAKPAPAAKAAPAPAATPQPATPAAPAAPVVKVESVDKYKTYGLLFLEQAAAAAAGQPASQTPDGKKAIANIKQAIAELKGQPPKMAPGAQAVTPTPKPAAKPATTLPVKAGSKALDVNKYDSGNFGSFYADAQKLGLSKKEAEDFLFDWMKKNQLTGIESKYMPAFIKDFNKAAGLSTAAATPAAAPKLADKLAAQSSSIYKNWDTAQLVKFQDGFMGSPLQQKANKAVIDAIQQELDARGYQKPTIPVVPYARPGSKDNRQGLNEGQFKVWGSFFKPFTEYSLNQYQQTGSASSWKSYVPGSLEAKQNKQIKNIHLNSEAWAQIKPGTKKDELPQVASIQRAVDNLGITRLKAGVKGIREFTGVTYEEIRNAQRNRVPRGYDYLDEAGKQKMIKEGKKKADDIEAVLGYMPKPQVPKMRGVAVDDDRLKELIEMANNRYTMQEHSMNSWSTNSRTPEQFADQGVDNGWGNNRVIYRTLNKKGSSVQGISNLSSEDEILTPSNAEYRFTGYHTVAGNLGYTYHIFDAVEY